MYALNKQCIIYIDSYFNNIDARTLGNLSDLLKPQDRCRFYKVNSLDNSTIVAVYQVRLELSGEVYRDRSDSDKEHAELDAIKKIKKWLDERNVTGQTTISLTTMATYSPCLKCQSAILDMLKKWREKLELTVSYKLRISYLYHGKPPQSDGAVRKQLADWKWNMKDSGVNFTLEPIAVCDELPVPSLDTRQENPKDVISQRRKNDSKIADHVQKINSQTRMEDYFEREARPTSLDVIPQQRENDSKSADHVQKINSQTRMEDYLEREARPTSLDVIPQQRENDSKSADHVQKINSQTRMEDYFERREARPGSNGDR